MLAIDTPAQAPAPAGTGKPAAQVLGFTQASRNDYLEPFLDSAANVLSANALNLGNTELPAFGYLRAVLLEVTASGGTGAAAVYQPDAPWSILGEVFLTDSNGQPLVGPINGYDLYLINLFGGGPAFDSDPLRSAAYSAPTAAGNFTFILRIPVEITARDGLGALANQNAASAYKLRVGIAAKADVFATDATVMPTVRVRAFMEAWTPAAGVAPPYLGTTQVWSKEAKVIAAGFQRHQLSRVGNAIRNLLVVTRNAAGARVSTIFPDPVQVKLDTRVLQNAPASVIRHYMGERFGVIGSALPTGVYALDYCHDFDGKPGGELRDQWLRTSSASRVELEGTYGLAGRAEILVNDVLAFAGVPAAYEG